VLTGPEFLDQVEAPTSEHGLYARLAALQFRDAKT
jgi:hypothetical protein